ncbi:MAG: sodium:solute symporter family protein, partial [Candidatus Midichloria sp.]|nr:sodium:solute symporter family protein [Candidatus Midichloria sp.]
IAIIILYFVICIAIGLYKAKSIKTLKEYTLGGRNFSNLVVITTLLATDIGAGSTVGIVEAIYTFGMFFAITQLFVPCFWLMMAKVYGKNIDQFLRCISVSDIMANLYGQAGRWITNVAAIFASIGVITFQATALGYVMNYILQIQVVYSTIIAILVLAFYSAFGGIRAVAYTDVFQFIILMLAIPAACFIVYGTESGGGIMHWHRVFDQLPKEVLTIDLNKSNIWLFFSFILYNFLPETGGTYVQRFLLSRNSKQLVSCIYTAAFLSIFFVITICLVGFFIRAKAPNIDPNAAFIYFIANHLCIGIKGLVIIGLLAVIMSTADSWLNTTSVLITHDIISKFIDLHERQSLIVARCSTFIIAILAILLSLSGKGVIELEWLGGNFWGPIIIIPLSAGFLRFRTNSKSFMASVVLAITFTCVSGYIVGDFATISLMCGMIGSAIGLFGMHRWQKGQSIDPAAKHKSWAAIEEKKQAKIGYANSAEQIEEWYQKSSDRNQKIESLINDLSKGR